MRLGTTTDSGDAEGRILTVRAVDVGQASVDAALALFRGPIQQVPPMHSALKRDGRPLYDYARRGITIERAARAVTIHRLDQVAFDGTTLTIAVDCSKGTYIRVLAEDIGRVLGCGAHLTALRRTRVGDVTLAEAVPLEAFESMSDAARAERLLPLDTLIGALPRIELDDALARRFCDGQRLAWTSAGHCGRVRVYRAAAASDAAPGDGGASDAEHGPLLLGTGLVGYDERLAPVRLVARHDTDGA